MEYSSEDKISLMYTQVVLIAEQIIAKELSMLDGACKISDIYFKFNPNYEYDDEDLMLFVAIASDTDVFPSNEARQFWSKEALAKKDIERQEIEDWAQKSGIETCHRLIERFKVGE